MAKQPYTVVGYTIGDYYSTFCEWAWSETPTIAIQKISKMVIKREAISEDMELDTVICAVFAGHHEDLQPDY